MNRTSAQPLKGGLSEEDSIEERLLGAVLIDEVRCQSVVFPKPPAPWRTTVALVASPVSSSNALCNADVSASRAT